MLSKFLKNIGLSEKEAKVYLANLEVGTNAASVVAKKAGLSRTTVYAVLGNLLKKRFVSCIEQNGVKLFSPEDPRSLEYLLEQKARKAVKNKEDFQNLLPELLRFTGRYRELPKVKYFEGIDGVKEIYQDTLKAEEKLAYSSIPNVDNEDLVDFIHNYYLPRRVEKGIRVRAILPDTPNGKNFHAKDSKMLRESRLVSPILYPFESEINIYGSKLAIMSLTGQFLHGVIIESESIVKTERSIFELAWIGANKA